jgi:predicted ArsR family transcriptional regulator
LNALNTWDVIELDELKEETGLSRWVLDEITKNLTARKIIRVNQDIPATPEGGRPGHLYLLTAHGRKYCDQHLPPQIKN